MHEPHRPPAPPRAVAVLGRGPVPPDAPVLRADDLGVLRGDGVFETIHVRGGRPQLLAEHLARLTRSAKALDLTVPDEQTLEELLTGLWTSWPAAVEGMLRLVCTRGPERSGPPTTYAILDAVPPDVLRLRRDGLSLLTLTFGYPTGVRTRAPWLLGATKTLSYAVNMAALRWATDHGADDVLWVSDDGFALEAPTATLAWLQAGTLCTVPPDTGILPGTTAAHLAQHTAELGWTTADRLVTPAELAGADAVWLLSAVRGVTPVHTLDGTPLPRNPELTARLQSLTGHPAPLADGSRAKDPGLGRYPVHRRV